MSNLEAPRPAPMPLGDPLQWYSELNLSQFINAYYQWRDIQHCNTGNRALVIGPGQGLLPEVLKWRGYAVKTLDLDETFRPDFIGSVHDMSMFPAQSFSVAIASHVLEHLAPTYLDSCLRELARVAKYALVYLPVPGRKLEIRLRTYGAGGLDGRAVIDFFNWFHKPDGISPRYCARQHFWELGRRGYTARGVSKRMKSYFEILSSYRNPDWPLSYNFVLRSKFSGGSSPDS